MSSYNILVLDDDHERLAAFKRNLIGNALTLVSTARDAINQLKLYKFALIFMDYDLDLHEQLDTAKTGTGMDVVEWIVANKQHFLRTSFIVHSLNPVGGPLMTATLKTAGLRVQAMPGVWKNAEFLGKL
jgi:CheY-like chemotaxis protein